MKKTFYVNGYECTCDSNNVHIIDSYKVKDIDGFIEDLHEAVKDDFKYKRSKWAWSNEWYAHNLCYKLGILRSHTKDVDLNDDEYLFAKIMYILIKPFARIICRF